LKARQPAPTREQALPWFVDAQTQEAGMEARKLRTERVEDIEAFALKHGMSAEEVQDLIDRVGNDREALEQAALVQEAEKDD
jgi:hypothetical protein